MTKDNIKIRLNNFILWCKGWYKHPQYTKKEDIIKNSNRTDFDDVKMILKLDGYDVEKNSEVLKILLNYIDDLNDMGITSRMSELRMLVWNSNVEKYMNWTHGDYERSLLSTIREFFAYSITKEHIKLNPPIYSRKLYKMGFVAPTHLGNSYKMCNSKVKRIFNK
jgi:hypothetical protein